jgi:hypothetical protein
LELKKKKLPTKIKIGEKEASNKNWNYCIFFLKFHYLNSKLLISIIKN